MSEITRKQLKLLLSTVTVERLSRNDGNPIDGFEISGHGARALLKALEAEGINTGTMTKSCFTLSDVQLAESNSENLIRSGLERAAGAIQRC